MDLEAGACVRGVVRNPDKARFLERGGVEFATADLMDREALTDSFRGCDAVVSSAALCSVRNSRWRVKAEREIGFANGTYADGLRETPRADEEYRREGLAP